MCVPVHVCTCTRLCVSMNTCACFTYRSKEERMLQGKTGFGCPIGLHWEPDYSLLVERPGANHMPSRSEDCSCPMEVVRPIVGTRGP